MCCVVSGCLPECLEDKNLSPPHQSRLESGRKRDRTKETMNEREREKEKQPFSFGPKEYIAHREPMLSSVSVCCGRLSCVLSLWLCSPVLQTCQWVRDRLTLRHQKGHSCLSLYVSLFFIQTVIPLIQSISLCQGNCQGPFEKVLLGRVCSVKEKL